MESWLTTRDMRDLECDDGKWHRVQVEYQPSVSIIKVDNEYVACRKEELNADS